MINQKGFPCRPAGAFAWSDVRAILVSLPVDGDPDGAQVIRRRSRRSEDGWADDWARAPAHAAVETRRQGRGALDRGPCGVASRVPGARLVCDASVPVPKSVRVHLGGFSVAAPGGYSSDLPPASRSRA
jgi:hypothetical protein